MKRTLRPVVVCSIQRIMQCNMRHGFGLGPFVVGLLWLHDVMLWPILWFTRRRSPRGPYRVPRNIMRRTPTAPHALAGRGAMQQ